MDVRQACSTVLMIRPAAFGFNPETAETNAFQNPDAALTPEQIRERALQEFDGLVSALRDANVEVLVFDDTEDPTTPDAVFPNNWVSFHENGDVYLYPMLAPIRRAEVRLDIIHRLGGHDQFEVDRVVDLTAYEAAGQFLEGTGSLVLDRVHHIAYAALSPRTHPAALDAFCRKTGYTAVRFDAADSQGQPVYHTNVIMCIGKSFAIVCADAIVDADQRADVLARLAASDRDVVQIDMAQMESFAGNMLEIEKRLDDGRVVVASTRAHAALRRDQRAKIEEHAQFVTADLETIETYGGGSARCMLAEVFLRRRVPDLAFAYASKCLDYTFESNRNQERRLNTLLVLSIGGFGLAKYMLDLLAGDEGATAILLRGSIFFTALPLGISLLIGIRGLRSREIKSESQMLPEHAAKEPGRKYVAEALEQTPRAMAERVMVESHALARAKLERTNLYELMSHFFIAGAISIVILLVIVVLYLQ